MEWNDIFIGQERGIKERKNGLEWESGMEKNRLAYYSFHQIVEGKSFRSLGALPLLSYCVKKKNDIPSADDSLHQQIIQLIGVDQVINEFLEIG